MVEEWIADLRFAFSRSSFTRLSSFFFAVQVGPACGLMIASYEGLSVLLGDA